MTREPLPIDAALPALFDALARDGRAVLQAPPGAGKTTRVPLALLDSGLVHGRILMLEPRRIAARASAERMAQTLGELVGRTVGYAMRGAARSGPDTRIEVITEGLLTRRLQRDPGLSGVGAVIFDEFHERSLQSDLALALTWEVRSALRENLLVLVMSATLDAAPVAALLDAAPVITSAGRAWPVETRWLDRPRPRGQRLEAAAADLTVEAVGAGDGGVLVFLPGEGEIRRVQAALAGRLPDGCRVLPLYGALPAAAQRAAIAPAQTGRKVVLATAIAETSLTIADVRIVVDAGLSRRARFDSGSGMSRLVTEKVTRAEADQRRGRAGRVAPGRCYRLWTKGEDGALAGFPPPEIANADLASLALDLAQWGAPAEDLAFLTPPPGPALAEARALLADLGGLDAEGAITAHGRAIAGLPLHPRLAHMLSLAGPAAAPLAALLADRDPLRGAGSDLAVRLAAITGDGSTGDGEMAGDGAAGTVAADAGALARIRSGARRLARLRSGGRRPRGARKAARNPDGPAPGNAPDASSPPDGRAMSPGAMAALAYPDRIALRRPGDAPRYLLSGGKGAMLDPADALAGHRLLVAADLDGDRTEARIRLAAPLSEADLRRIYGDRILTVRDCVWEPRGKRVLARIEDRLGALVLSARPWADVPAEARARAALEGLRSLGLGALKPSEPFRLLRARLALARAERPDLPDPSDAALLEDAERWLLPYLGGIRSAEDLRALDPAPALAAALDWDGGQALDRIAPPAYTTPLGRRIAIDYAGEAPEIRLRLQELFGETRHPTIAGQPLLVTLLSPAGRPVQTTMDLPGFWSGSYADVRKDMRARYPKHPWPDDPAKADPTLRAKPRG